MGAQDGSSRAYGIEGLVTRGHGIGRQLLLSCKSQIQNRVVPRMASTLLCWLTGSGISVTNIGKRPTLAEKSNQKSRLHLLDFDGDLYDQTIRIRLLHRLRGEKKFSGSRSVEVSKDSV
ncbi:MAG: riboflavin kinase [Acidobacteria bacterium]|nr:riboflavin kinase [Acidobacteriota bacterium]